MTIGGGFWAGALHAAGRAPHQFDVQYFPVWSVQKHLLGDAGYAMLKTSPNKAIAWEFMKSLTEPAVLGVGLFTALPILASFVLSLFNYSIVQPTRWVGLANYRAMVHDSGVQMAFAVTLFLAVGIAVAQVVVGLGLAVAVQRRGRLGPAELPGGVLRAAARVRGLDLHS